MLREERQAAAALILELNQEDFFPINCFFFTSSGTILVQNNFPSSDILI